MKTKLIYHPNIYLGESLKPSRLFIYKNKIKACKGDFYLIVTSPKPDELLEIITPQFLKNHLYDDMELTVGGLAGYYDEALELVRLITQDCINKRNDTNVKEYIECGRYY